MVICLIYLCFAQKRIDINDKYVLSNIGRRTSGVNFFFISTYKLDLTTNIYALPKKLKLQQRLGSGRDKLHSSFAMGHHRIR